MEDKNLYEKARARVTEIKEFYSHLISYIIVNAILIFINLMFSPGYLWFLWVCKKVTKNRYVQIFY